jgi:hypothetical protein
MVDLEDLVVAVVVLGVPEEEEVLRPPKVI